MHRDIKSANVLVKTDMDVLLTDFGTARLISRTVDQRKKEELVGTTEYMAPEVGLQRLYRCCSYGLTVYSDV